VSAWVPIVTNRLVRAGKFLRYGAFAYLEHDDDDVDVPESKAVRNTG